MHVECTIFFGVFGVFGVFVFFIPFVALDPAAFAFKALTLVAVALAFGDLLLCLRFLVLALA